VICWTESTDFWKCCWEGAQVCTYLYEMWLVFRTWILALAYFIPKDTTSKQNSSLDLAANFYWNAIRCSSYWLDNISKPDGCRLTKPMLNLKRYRVCPFLSVLFINIKYIHSFSCSRQVQDQWVFQALKSRLNWCDLNVSVLVLLIYYACDNYLQQCVWVGRLENPK
jgi:hypothetical protein